MEDKRRERQVNCRLNFVSFRSFIFTCCDFNLFLWLARYGYGTCFFPRTFFIFTIQEKEARKKLDNEEKEENDDQDEDGEGEDDLLD